jgi:hypothetical protein
MRIILKTIADKNSTAPHIIFNIQEPFISREIKISFPLSPNEPKKASMNPTKSHNIIKWVIFPRGQGWHNDVGWMKTRNKTITFLSTHH